MRIPWIAEEKGTMGHAFSTVSSVSAGVGAVGIAGLGEESEVVPAAEAAASTFALLNGCAGWDGGSGPSFQ